MQHLKEYEKLHEETAFRFSIVVCENNEYKLHFLTLEAAFIQLHSSSPSFRRYTLPYMIAISVPPGFFLHNYHKRWETHSIVPSWLLCFVEVIYFKLKSIIQFSSIFISFKSWDTINCGIIWSCNYLYCTYVCAWFKLLNLSRLKIWLFIIWTTLASYFWLLNLTYTFTCKCTMIIIVVRKRNYQHGSKVDELVESSNTIFLLASFY